MKISYFFLIALICISCAKKPARKPAPVIYLPPPIFVPPTIESPRPVIIERPIPKPKPIRKPIRKPITIKPKPKEVEITLGDVVVENPK